MRSKKWPTVLLTLLGISILIPLVLLILWAFTARWPWPHLLPKKYSLRTIRELLFGHANLPKLLLSSFLLSSLVAILTTIISAMAARALLVYNIPAKKLITGFALLPLIIPSVVFTMGFQFIMLKMNWGDSIQAVVLSHILIALPYSFSVMRDISESVGTKLEEQAAVLSARPWRAFIDVTLPLLMPGVFSSLSLAFTMSYSQYFTTLIVGGGRVQTLSLILIPYIQSGDRSLASIYSLAFILSALLVFFLLEFLYARSQQKGPSHAS